MIRILVGIALLLAPTVAYFLYLWIAYRFRLARAATGDPAHGREAVRNAPWLWLLGAGVVLMAASLVVLAEFGREPPGGTYVPPRMIDGEIVPGHVIPADEAEEGGES